MINQSALQVAQDFEDLANAADDILRDLTMALSPKQTDALNHAKARLTAAADVSAVDAALALLEPAPADVIAIVGATEEANETMAHIKANAATIERSLLVLAAAVHLSVALGGPLAGVRASASELYKAATFYKGAIPRRPTTAAPFPLDEPGRR